MTLQGEDLLKAWESVRSSGVTQEQHAKELGVSYETYKARYYRAMAARRYAKMVDDKYKLEKPELFDVTRFESLEFAFDDFVAVCDVHVPCTDYDFAMLPARIAEKHLKRGKRVLVVHGDVFNADLFSRWPKVVESPTWAQERQAASNLFALWSQTFDQIIVMPGNHDYNMIRRVEGQVSFGGMMWGMVDEQDKDLAQMFGGLFSTGKLQVSPVDHCFVNTSQGRYIIAHGSNYSVNPLTVANEMSQKYQAHVIMGHEHHLGMGMDRFGRYFIINNGGLFDDTKFAYVTLQASKRPKMKRGFTLVQGGLPTLLGAWTDWSKWL